jgi:hypothetical protein
MCIKKNSLHFISVYPLSEQESEVQTSLVNNSPHSAQAREAKIASEKAARSLSPKKVVGATSFEIPVSQVNSTGFYYKPGTLAEARLNATER